MEDQDNEEKTISFLRKKGWFKILKIFYVIIVLMALIALFYLVYVHFRPLKVVDNENTLISCRSGDKFRASDKGFDFVSDDLMHFEQRTLAEFCFNQEKVDSITDVWLGMAGSEVNYEVAFAYTQKGGWDYVFLGWLSSIVSLIVFSKILKRIIYFLALGNFFPKK